MDFHMEKEFKSPVDPFFLECDRLSGVDGIINYQIVTIGPQDSGDNIET